MLLCCFVALRDTGIVSNKYLFPLKIKGCIGMFDFLLSGDYIVMKTQMCSYNEMFLGENQTDTGTGIVSKKL